MTAPAPPPAASDSTVALVLFNRPELTARAFASIRDARPARLYLIADGPRADRPGEADRVAAARAATEAVDWPCEVTRDYSDENLGCARRVASGLNRVFDEVETAIVLEDDCVPHPSFFRYCETLLDRYRDDERVFVVSGDNFQDGVRRGEAAGPDADDAAAGYYFSKYPHCWGWATWRRAWRHFSPDVPFWPEVRESGLFAAVCPDPAERAHWTAIFDRVHRGETDSWAYPWTLSIWMQHGLTALPNVNLVSNVGFGEDATHTDAADSPFGRLPTGEVGPLTAPRFVVADADADAYTARTMFGVAPPAPPPPSRGRRLSRGAVRRARTLLGRLSG